MKKALARTAPEDADPNSVGRAVVDIVAAPYGQRPLRVHVDPASDGAAVTFAVMDRVRSEFLHRIGYADPVFTSRSIASILPSTRSKRRPCCRPFETNYDDGDSSPTVYYGSAG